MRFPCTINQRPGGQWSVRHEGSTVGTVEVAADTRENALEKMRRELQYRLELCPCTGELYQHVDIQLVPTP
jgi:hypothetical protein